jgi:hypothetical protein
VLKLLIQGLQFAEEHHCQMIVHYYYSCCAFKMYKILSQKHWVSGKQGIIIMKTSIENIKGLTAAVDQGRNGHLQLNNISFTCKQTCMPVFLLFEPPFLSTDFEGMIDGLVSVYVKRMRT